MFYLHTLKHILRIPPDKFGMPKEQSAYEILREEYEGIIDGKLGFCVAVVEVHEVGLGKIIHGDARTHHEVVFSILTFKPTMHEVVEGQVVEIVEFGAFIRLGPQDGLNHVSQITNDYIQYDEPGSRFLGKETGRVLQEGDTVRARIIAVSMGGGLRAGKLGLTMRQPFLGKAEWIENDLELLEMGELPVAEVKKPQKKKSAKKSRGKRKR
ncbi:MAG: DNA-directed RNA polymerase [Promethearchaeota archaeon]